MILVLRRGTGPATTAITLHFHRARTPAWDYSLPHTVTTDGKGRWSRPVAATANYRCYATAGTGATSQISSVVQFQPTPTVNGASIQLVHPNSRNSLTGAGVPGSLVYLHLAQLGARDVPGPYDVVRLVPVAANGSWAWNYLGSRGYGLFASRDSGTLPLGALIYLLATG